MDLTTAAADLLLGASCPGCGHPAVGLCARCAVGITPRPAVVRTEPVDIAAAGQHDGVLRLAIVAWKEEGRSAIVRPLAHLLAASVLEVADPARPLVLVPVPSTRRSRRARGADVVDELARHAAELLRTTGMEVDVRQVLRVRRRVADQSGLGARDREDNLRGAFAARSTRKLEGRDVVVVDDIVTTGATLREAVRVLTGTGRRPRAAAVAAHRPRR